MCPGSASLCAWAPTEALSLIPRAAEGKGPFADHVEAEWGKLGGSSGHLLPVFRDSGGALARLGKVSRGRELAAIFRAKEILKCCQLI